MTDQETSNAITAVAQAYLHLVVALDKASTVSGPSLAATLEEHARSANTNDQTRAIFLSLAKVLRNPAEIQNLQVP